MQLSIIIVNFKSPELTVDCLATVYGQTRTIDFEVILVDNNSADNSRELICESYPEVQWIAMDYNAGFARANNAGIRRARGEVILLLNSDTLNVNSAIENCFLKFIDSTYVACGVQLLNTDGTPQISGNYVMKGGLNHLLPLPYVGKLIRWAGNLFSVRKPNVPDASDEVKVDWINGAFLMVRKSAIDRAGVLDEDFFLYAEEAEWCSRLRKVGEMCIYGQFKVVHLQGASADKTFQSRQKGYQNLYDRKGMQIMLSNLVRVRKEFGVSWFLFQLLMFTATIPLFFVLGFLENLFTLRNPFRDLLLAVGFTKNVMKVWSLSGTIIRNRPFFYKVL